MVRPSLPDPAAIHRVLWDGFSGIEGWDVGANCGQTALDMAFGFLHVTSFEPSPDSFAAAQEVIRLHGLNATAINIALSDHDGTVELAYPAQEQRETGQLVTPGTAGMEWEPADWEAVEKVVVECRMADTFARARGFPDFIKVDTEGHEVMVLIGAAEIIADGGTDFLVEFHSPGNRKTCETLLRAAGHTVEVVRHPDYLEESPMWHQHGWLRSLAPRRNHART